MREYLEHPGVCPSLPLVSSQYHPNLVTPTYLSVACAGDSGVSQIDVGILTSGNCFLAPSATHACLTERRGASGGGGRL